MKYFPPKWSRIWENYLKTLTDSTARSNFIEQLNLRCKTKYQSQAIFLWHGILASTCNMCKLSKLFLCFSKCCASAALKLAPDVFKCWKLLIIWFLLFSPDSHNKWITFFHRFVFSKLNKVDHTKHEHCIFFVSSTDPL